MELRRKIDVKLLEWKNRVNHKPLILSGIRQSGKTYSVMHFAKNNYKNILYFNFMKIPELKKIFNNSLDVNDLLPLLSAFSPKTRFVPRETILIFDEIQECPRARLSLKSFVEDNRFDVIATGSFLGIKGYNHGDGTPLPVGYEEVMTMRTMDFEEFLWANGYDDSFICGLRKCWHENSPVHETLHHIFLKLFRQYLCIGGFPEAISIFMDTHNLQLSLNKVKSIVNDLENDFGRRIGKDGKPLFKSEEVARIRNAFSLVPFFLAKENKRYTVSKISGSNQEQKLDALSYLEDAGIIVRSYNLDIISIPLEMQKNSSQFKVFPSDIGILVSLLETDAPQAILQGNLGIGKGALYEGLVADSLIKSGLPLYYFSKTPSPEVDFVENIGGKAVILEVKSENGNAKSAKTILSHPDHYGKAELIKLVSGNIGSVNGKTTLPYFMTFLLGDSENLKTEDLSFMKMKNYL